MAEDVGGLRYPIKVGDEFSTALDALLEKIDLVRKGFEGLQGLGASFKPISEAAREAAKATTKHAEASDEVAAAVRRQIDALQRQSTELKAEIALNQVGIQTLRQVAEARKDNASAARAQAREERKALEQAEKQALQSNQDLLDFQKKRQKAQLALLNQQQRDREQVEEKQRRVALENAQIQEDFRQQQRQRELADLESAIRQRDKLERESVKGVAQQRIDAEKKRLAVAQEIVKQAQTDLTIPKGVVAQAQREIKTLNAELATTQRTGNRISFTFRRLFGILAVFTIARRALQVLTEGIRSAIRFNAEIEKAVLGIASLIVAVGDVRKPTGEAAKGAEAIALATTEARRQMALLRVESSRTSASLNELIETFQVAVGPGLQAGLNLDEIRKFTIEVSQAASAVGLSQAQLAEEIRSILQGTIRVQQTRIAAALGISNEDVKRAKELGNFAQFLNEKFAAFAAAGEEALGTFDRILASIKRSLDLALGEGGREFFDTLKSLLKNFKDILTSEKGGILEVNPAIVQILRGAFAPLTTLLAQTRDVITSPGFKTFLTISGQIADNLARALKLAVNLAAVKPLQGSLFFLMDQLSAGGDATGATAGFFNNLLVDGRIFVTKLSGEFDKMVLHFQNSLKTVFGAGLNQDQLEEQFRKVGDQVEAEIHQIQLESGRAFSIDLFSGLPVVLGGARKDLEEQGNLARDLNDVFLDAQNILRTTLGTLGAEGASLQENLEIARTENEIRKKDRDFATQLAQEEGRRNSILVAQRGLKREIESLGAADRAELDRRVKTLKRVFDIEQEISQFREDAARQEDEAIQARDKGNTAEEAALRNRAFISRARALELEIEAKRLRASEKQLTVGKEQADQQQKINELAQKTVTAEGEIKTVEENIGAIEKDRSDLASKEFLPTIQRIRQSAAEEAEALRRGNEERRAQLDAEQAILQTRRSSLEIFTGDRLDIQLAQAQALLSVENQRLSAQRQQVESSLAVSKVLAEDARLRENGTQRVVELDNQVAQLETLLASIDEERNQKLGETAKKLEEIRAAQGNILREAVLGARVALAQFNAQTLDTFQTFGQAMTTTLEGIVEIGKGLFASIFDPNANFSIREALGRLALQIGQDLFASAIRSLILSITAEKLSRETSAETAAAILHEAAIFESTARINSATIAAAILAGSGGLAGAGGGGSAGTPIGFFARGGEVDHYSPRARGFARGTRPAHIPASDTVPAWLTPGEWVMRLQSVRRYGEGVMDSINRGLVDPALLQAVAGRAARRGPSLPTDVAAPVALARGGPVPNSGGNSMTVLPAVQVNQRTMELLLANQGARGVLKRFLAQEGVPMGGQ